MKPTIVRSPSFNALLAALLLIVTGSTVAKENTAQSQFFSSLLKLCDTRFEGQMTFPTEGQDSFAGKLLVAQFPSCDELEGATEIRVPFIVGEDKSRTWIFSKVENGLQLKHDHRHEDGTPDEVNMYGGIAKGGTHLSQAFAADQHTKDVIPAAATNVWNISLSEDAKRFTYHLERHAAPRFTAELAQVESQVE